MTNTTFWIFLVILFFICNAKRKVAFERMGPFYFSPELGIMEESVTRLGRDILCVNYNFTLNRDVDPKTMVMAKMYKFADNTYKETAILYKRNICDFFDNEVKLLFDLEHNPSFKNFFHGCPIKKGRYTANNINTKNIEIPFFIPLWKVKFLLEMREKSKLILNQTVYLSVVNENP